MKKHWIKCMLMFAAMMMTGSVALAGSAVINNGSDPGSRLNMRTGPSRDASLLGKFSSGTQVEIVSNAGDGWAEVVIGGGRNRISGYMMEQYLDSSADVDAREMRQVVSPYGTQTVVLRDRPSNSYDAVMMLQVGDMVTLIGVSGDFCYVQTADLSVGCLLRNELK